MSQTEESKEPRGSGAAVPEGERRSFIRWAIGGIAGLIGAGLLIPLAGYVISPALKRRQTSWADVGSVDALQAGQPQELEFSSTVKDGWRTVAAKKVIWAVKQSGGNIVTFSPLCPHLGCGFRWDFDEKKFKCPCHGSIYDVTGKVLGGPAPRPLDVLPSKVENGHLFVIYKQFKSGLDRPVEL